jgi:hypothetical protein
MTFIEHDEDSELAKLVCKLEDNCDDKLYDVVDLSFYVEERMKPGEVFDLVKDAMITGEQSQLAHPGTDAEVQVTTAMGIVYMFVGNLEHIFGLLKEIDDDSSQGD